jgi:hypothetical protein
VRSAVWRGRAGARRSQRGRVAEILRALHLLRMTVDRAAPPVLPDSIIAGNVVDAVLLPVGGGSVEGYEGGGGDPVPVAGAPGLQEASADPGSDGVGGDVEAVRGLVDGEIRLGAGMGCAVAMQAPSTWLTKGEIGAWILLLGARSSPRAWSPRPAA